MVKTFKNTNKDPAQFWGPRRGTNKNQRTKPLRRTGACFTDRASKPRDSAERGPVDPADRDKEALPSDLLRVQSSSGSEEPAAEIRLVEETRCRVL